MKKTIKYLVFSLLMLFGFSLNVNAETLPAAVDGKITLDKDYTIDSVTFDSSSDVSVLDLNGKTITLNGIIKLAKKIEIKNGIIIRSSLQNKYAMIEISGDVNINNLVIDGNKGVTDNTSSSYPYPYAALGIYVINNGTAVLDKVTLKDHYTGNGYGSGAINALNANSIIIKNSEFYGNRAQGEKKKKSAAIYVKNAKNVELINTKIHDNYSMGYAIVGIVNVENFLMDKDTSLYNNEAANVGGIHISDSNAVIAGTFKDNKSNNDNGGALYTIFTDNAYTNNVITISETARFINNETAFAGGALYVNSDKTNVPGKVVINGATFTGNKALGTVDESDGLYKDIGGGAIAVARGILEINDIKMSGNTSSTVGAGIVVSHANGNPNGGKLTINGGTFGDAIDLGVGSIVVNGGTFKDDMAEYITNTKLISKKTANGYEIVENKVLEDDEVTFENESAMDSGLELVITDKSDTLKDEKVKENIKEVIEEEVKAETKDEKAKVKDVEVLALYDISVSNGTNTVEMKDGKFKITINIDEDLLTYDNYAGIYIDDEGNVTYLPVDVKDGKATFETSHLSTYGVVGYNNVVEEVKNPETVVNVEIIVTVILLVLMSVGIGISMKKQEGNA